MGSASNLLLARAPRLRQPPARPVVGADRSLRRGQPTSGLARGLSAEVTGVVIPGCGLAGAIHRRF
jgi:hypothetical protein